MQRVVDRLLRIPVWLQSLCAVLLVAFYAQRIWTVAVDTGLFRRIGFDWGLFYSQAAALASGDVGAMYQVGRLEPYLQRLAMYTTTPDVALMQWPSPYPPLLAALLVPLTALPPPAAFGLWTVLGLACVCQLVWRINQLIPGAGWVRMTAILLTT